MAQRLRRCATNRKVAGLIPAGVIGIFHWHKILLITLWPWGRLSLQQKWVPGAFPGGKGGRCVGLTTLLLSCAIVMKSGNLKRLETSGPLQVCHGTALLVPLVDKSGPLMVYEIVRIWQIKHNFNERCITCLNFINICGASRPYTKLNSLG